MDNTQYDKIISNFFQIFSESVKKTLSKSLDPDVFNINTFEMKYTSKTNDAESLKNTNAIYKLDYALGISQGSLSVLIPEEIIASISDVITGGNGNEAYKGSLSEIETNSILKILEKIFKNIEIEFKKYYEQDLAFSANSKLLLKEKEEQFFVNNSDTNYDFIITCELTLSEEQKGEISIIMNSHKINEIIDRLGLSKSEAQQIKPQASGISLENLCDVKINITAELGRAQVPIKYALELVRGSLIELDTLNNSEIKVFANGVEFAKAQVVAVEENFGLKITKIIPPEERMQKS